MHRLDAHLCGEGDVAARRVAAEGGALSKRTEPCAAELRCKIEEEAHDSTITGSPLSIRPGRVTRAF